MPAPIHESDDTATVNSGGSVTVNKPTGTVENDWLIAGLVVRDNPTSLTAPAGWTVVIDEVESDDTATNCLMSIWKKKAGGSEPSTYDFTWTGGNDAACGICRISGGDSTDIIDASGSIDAPSQTDTDDNDCPSVTTTVADTLVQRWTGAQRGSNYTRTAPASHDERWNITSGAGNGDIHQGMADQEQASIGATGVETWTSTSGRSGSGHTIALAPSTAVAVFQDAWGMPQSRPVDVGPPEAVPYF